MTQMQTLGLILVGWNLFERGILEQLSEDGELCLYEFIVRKRMSTYLPVKSSIHIQFEGISHDYQLKEYMF